MRAIEASGFRNLLIENIFCADDSGDCASSRASIEFLCDRAIGNDESMCLPLALSEFSLADLTGHPHLLGRVERNDGRIEFRYALCGPLLPHRSLS